LEAILPQKGIDDDVDALKNLFNIATDFMNAPILGV